MPKFFQLSAFPSCFENEGRYFYNSYVVLVCKKQTFLPLALISTNLKSYLKIIYFEFITFYL